MIEQISPMIIDNRNLLDDLFDGFSDYEKYIKDNALHELVGIDLKSSEQCIQLAEKYKSVYATCGIHPHESDKAPKRYLYELEEFYNYSAEIQKTIRNYVETRFFTAVDNRTLRRNAVAFLWWAVELTHSPWDRWDNIEKRSDDKYHYTRILLKDTDIYQQTFERTLGKEPRIVFPLLDAIFDNKLSRPQHRELIKRINSDAHIYHYSVLSPKQTRHKIDSLLQAVTS